MSSPELAIAANERGHRARRFAVAWRNRTSTQIHAVGILDAESDRYRFRYLSTAVHTPGFRPFIGFPVLDEPYESTRLWPFFALRAMDRRRPDFPTYVERLGLTTDATVLDILARSGGEQQGDTVYMIAEPSVGADGRTECVFLVRGARYATEQFASAGVAEHLQPGDALRFLPDASNPVNHEALVVATADGPALGWVPDLLVPYFRVLAERHADLVVVRNNGPDAPWHLRLLVRAAGKVDPTIQVFTGPNWTTLAP